MSQSDLFYKDIDIGLGSFISTLEPWAWGQIPFQSRTRMINPEVSEGARRSVVQM